MPGNFFNSGASYCQNSSDYLKENHKHSKVFVDSVENRRMLSNKKSTPTSVLTRPCISVVGLGQQGLNLIARFAKNQFRVIAVDQMPSLVKTICNASLPEVEEPVRGILEKARHQKRLSATTDLTTAVKCSQVTILSDSVLDSPAIGCYQSRIRLNNAIIKIANAYKCMSQYQTLLFNGEFDMSLIKSTYIPILERTSHKKLGLSFGVGSVIENYEGNFQLRSLYVKGFDKRSQLNVRRLYKNTPVKSKFYDYADAV